MQSINTAGNVELGKKLTNQPTKKPTRINTKSLDQVSAEERS